MSVKAKIVIDTTDVEMIDNIMEAHWRIIWSNKDHCGYVVCVQEFDYCDYPEFIGEDCFAYKEDAEDTLLLMNQIGMNFFRS